MMIAPAAQPADGVKVLDHLRSLAGVSLAASCRGVRAKRCRLHPNSNLRLVAWKLWDFVFLQVIMEDFKIF